MVRATHLTTNGLLMLAALAFATSASAQTGRPAAPPKPATPPAPATGALSAADTRDANIRAYIDLMRSDVRAQKVAIITEMMQFTEDEDKKFWPIYREYEAELAKLNDDRMALIKRYADNFETLTDATADQLARGALDLEGKRQALKVKYYDRFSSALPKKTAAKYIQVENQILLIFDLQIAASLPIVQ